MDREKVIKGLECRLDINGSKYKHCLTCDYRHDIDHCQWACQTDGILEDALALLKAQEPRVMTLEEVEEGQAYWLEMRGIASEYAICKMNDHGDSAFLDFSVQHGDKTLESVGYGKRFRCWTSRPDQATREATPWEK